MKNITQLLIVTLFLISFNMQAQNKTFHDFSATTIDGEIMDFSTLKGKKVLVVNTASKCGFTPQYEGLEALYKQYGGDHFIIIGFPANNFLKQEPGSNEEIKSFCTLNYGGHLSDDGQDFGEGKRDEPDLSVAYQKIGKRGNGFKSKMEFPKVYD